MFSNLELSISSYDTAWVAMVPSPDSAQYPCFPECLEWLLNNQHSDGSWSPHCHPMLIKDSLSSTLASVLALKRWNVAEETMKRGLHYIEANSGSVNDEKQQSPIGFDIIFAGMIDYANELGLNLPLSLTLVDELRHRRDLEIKRVHPITAVQLEWSLWTRDVEEEIVPTCRELGIGIVANPIGGGFFSSGSKLVDILAPDDVRKFLPRFQTENLKHNIHIFERVNEMVSRKGCTPSQLALAWVHHQGSDVCPIPGSTKIENLNHNIGALSVKLTPEEMVELESCASEEAVKGDRYGPYGGLTSTWMESDTPPLSSWKGK